MAAAAGAAATAPTWPYIVGGALSAVGSIGSALVGGSSTRRVRANKYGGEAHRQQIASHWNETMRMAQKHGIHPLVAAGVRPSSGPPPVHTGGTSGSSGMAAAASLAQSAGQTVSRYPDAYTREMQAIALAQEREKLKQLQLANQNPAIPTKEGQQTTNDLGVIGGISGQQASVYQQSPIPRKDQIGITEGAPAAESYYDLEGELVPAPSQAYSEPLDSAIVPKGQYAYKGITRLWDTWTKPYQIAPQLRKMYPKRPTPTKGWEWRWTNRGTWKEYPPENKLFADPNLSSYARNPAKRGVRVEEIKRKRPKFWQNYRYEGDLW